MGLNDLMQDAVVVLLQGYNCGNKNPFYATVKRLILSGVHNLNTICAVTSHCGLLTL